jgi:hypothetical protein
LAKQYPDADLDALSEEEEMYRDLFDRIVGRAKRRDQLRRFLHPDKDRPLA